MEWIKNYREWRVNESDDEIDWDDLDLPDFDSLDLDLDDSQLVRSMGVSHFKSHPISLDGWNWIKDKLITDFGMSKVGRFESGYGIGPNGGSVEIKFVNDITDPRNVKLIRLIRQWSNYSTLDMYVDFKSGTVTGWRNQTLSEIATAYKKGREIEGCLYWRDGIPETNGELYDIIKSFFENRSNDEEDEDWSWSKNTFKIKDEMD